MAFGMLMRRALICWWAPFKCVCACYTSAGEWEGDASDVLSFHSRLVLWGMRIPWTLNISLSLAPDKDWIICALLKSPFNCFRAGLKDFFYRACLVKLQIDSPPCQLCLNNSRTMLDPQIANLLKDIYATGSNIIFVNNNFIYHYYILARTGLCCSNREMKMRGAGHGFTFLLSVKGE